MANEPDPLRRKRHKTQPPPLTVRETRFCQIYAETGNGTRSYVEAGLPHKSENVANQLALRLLRKVTIRSYIRELQTQAADAARATVNKLIQGLSRVAFADRTAIFAADGTVLPPGEWPPEVRAIVAGVEVEEHLDADRQVTVRKWKVKFERSMEAKKLLAQYLKMIGRDAATEGEKPAKPLVVGGEADVGSL